MVYVSGTKAAASSTVPAPRTPVPVLAGSGAQGKRAVAVLDQTKDFDAGLHVGDEATLANLELTLTLIALVLPPGHPTERMAGYPDESR